MTFDLATLFDYLRKAPFGGRISKTQMEGVEEVLKAWETYGKKSNKQLAYVLATAFHETGATMQPVLENLNYTSVANLRRVWPKRFPTDDSAKPYVRNAKKLANFVYGGRMGNKQPDDGWTYRGRGLVQITGRDNYKRIGARLGLALEDNPDYATDPAVSAMILVIGMVEGIFTTRKLSQYFSGQSEDPVGARAIINGTDKASLIATYYTQFLGALEAADMATPLPTKVEEAAAEPDGAKLTKDSTLIGGITAIGGSGLVGALGSIGNPWAFAAFVVLAVGAYLFLTGRIEIKRKAGV